MDMNELEQLLLAWTNDRSDYEFSIDIFTKYRDGFRNWDQVKAAIIKRYALKYAKYYPDIPFPSDLFDSLFEHYHEEVYGYLYDKSLQEQQHLETAVEHFKEVSNQLTKEEEPMPKLIETKTFIRGTVASEVSDQDIYNHISEVELKIKELDKIEHKPKSLKKQIEMMRQEIIDLVAFVDKRDEGDAE